MKRRLALAAAGILAGAAIAATASGDQAEQPDQALEFCTVLQPWACTTGPHINPDIELDTTQISFAPKIEMFVTYELGHRPGGGGAW